jgi:hypothetical protein
VDAARCAGRTSNPTWVGTVSEVDVWCSVCMHGYSTMVAALAASLTRAAGWHLRAVGVGCTGREASPKYRISGGRDSGVIADHPHAPRRATIGRPNPSTESP